MSQIHRRTRTVHHSQAKRRENPFLRRPWLPVEMAKQGNGQCRPTRYATRSLPDRLFELVNSNPILKEEAMKGMVKCTNCGVNTPYHIMLKNGDGNFCGVGCHRLYHRRRKATKKKEK